MRTRAEMPYLSGYRHDRVHHPVIDGAEVKPVPYLTLPFRQESLVESVRNCQDNHFNSRRLYDITEGSRYSRAEERIHGYIIHGGVDYHAPYGTAVVAPCNGLAVSSYHSFPLEDGSGNSTKLQGKELYFGLGYFVQIYNPETNRFVVLGHLSDVDVSIPFGIPIHDEKGWTPTNYKLKISELGNNAAVVSVKRGDVVGKLGYSGLRWGYDDYIENAERPIVINPVIYQSYDEPHVHFEEYWRDQESGVKSWQRDPYDIYLTAKNYPTPTRRRQMGPEPLFHLDERGLPTFAE